MRNETISPERIKAFLLDLIELTRKHGLDISGCCCCGSPFIGEADVDERAGYYCDTDGSNLKWVAPKDTYTWAAYSDKIVRKETKV